MAGFAHEPSLSAGSPVPLRGDMPWGPRRDMSPAVADTAAARRLGRRLPLGGPRASASPRRRPPGQAWATSAVSCSGLKGNFETERTEWPRAVPGLCCQQKWVRPCLGVTARPQRGCWYGRMLVAPGQPLGAWPKGRSYRGGGGRAVDGQPTRDSCARRLPVFLGGLWRPLGAGSGRCLEGRASPPKLGSQALPA